MTDIKNIYDYTLTFEKAQASPLWASYKKIVATMELRAVYEPKKEELKSNFGDFNFAHIVAEWGGTGSGIEIDLWAIHHENKCVHLFVTSRQGERVQEQEFFNSTADDQFQVIMENLIIPFCPFHSYFWRK